MAAKTETKFPIQLRPTQTGAPTPIWDGDSFVVGNSRCRVLEYDCGSTGWNDDLSFFAVETAGSDHCIEVASRKNVIRLTKQTIEGRENPIVLEIGSSSGFMLELLHRELKNANVIGADIVPEPLKLLGQRLPMPLLRFDWTACPLPDNCVDTVVALNVLEHVENDAKAIEHLFRILKPGGHAVLEVPAGPNLYDDYDRIMQHFRRYSMQGFCELLSSKGLEITYKTHLGCLIYPGFWAAKKWRRARPSSSLEIAKEKTARSVKLTKVADFLGLAFELELKLGKMIEYPFGIRCVVVCRKPA